MIVCKDLYRLLMEYLLLQIKPPIMGKWIFCIADKHWVLGLIANLEYRGNIYRKMSKNADWRGKTKPIMAQLPFLYSTNIPQAY